MYKLIPLEKTIFIFVLIVSFFIYLPFGHAQWSSDPMVNNSVNTVIGNQWDPEIISDGTAGGTIIVWDDSRSGTDLDIYVQKLNDNGIIQWSANGVVICNAINDQFLPQIISDGTGGAIITWTDFRSGGGDIYAQRVNENGVVQWATNGVPLCNATDNQSFPKIIFDGAGGAIVTWQDLRNGFPNRDIYAQRVNENGVVLWTTNGVVICNELSQQFDPEITTDGAGGAIITWTDFRSGGGDIYAQRINTNGVVQWTTNGIPLCNATDNQSIPKIIFDSAGGAIVTWQDLRNGFQNSDIYAQRVNDNGVVLWTTNGVVICNELSQQFSPVITTDGAEGALITWQDLRNTIDDDIYMQRIDATGIVQWTENGIVISSAGGSQGNKRIVPDGNDGAIIVWSDLVVTAVDGNLVVAAVDGNVYAQRVNNGGFIQWTIDGVEVCSATGDQFSPVIITEGGGGAIVSWSDGRNQSTTSADIYAQKVNADGSLGGTTAVDDNRFTPIEFSLEQNYPNPFNPSTNIQYAISSLPDGKAGRQFVTLKIYDVLGNEIATLVNEEKPAGSYEVKFEASNLSSGIYFYKLMSTNFIETKKMILLR
jgi:phosphosulfolactate phosphohydrolase-like enzyme